MTFQQWKMDLLYCRYSWTGDRQRDIQSFSHKEGRGTGSAIQYNNKWIKLEDRQELVIGYQETGKGEFII